MNESSGLDGIIGWVLTPPGYVDGLKARISALEAELAEARAENKLLNTRLADYRNANKILCIYED